MRACIPTDDDTGLDARIHGHFGSAPFFTIVDTETGDLTTVANGNAAHAHGTCHPLGQIAGRHVDCIVVGGIGRRALMGLHRAGLKVYRPGAATVADALAALRAGTLQEFDDVHACGGHGHGHGSGGCSH